MATMQAPAPTKQAEQQAPSQKVYPPQPKGEAAAEEGKGAMVPVDSPSKEKLVQEDAASRSAPVSPKTPGTDISPTKKHNISPGQRGSNLKAEAFADAHSKRVEAEAQTYIDAEVRKADAHAEKQKAVAEKEKMREEAKAQEQRKKEEQRADLLVHQATLKADKIVEQAKEKAVMIKATAQETAEKHIAEANAAAEREKAGIEEGKSKKMAEIKDKAETMIASGELVTPNHKGVGQRLKENLICSS